MFSLSVDAAATDIVLDQKRAFPEWEELYQQEAVESLPWYNPELDRDLEDALDKLGIRSGSVLDLGSGPGTQAMQLARRGFAVTATDISRTAVRKAKEKADGQGLAITWKQDDVLDTRLRGLFDLIFDRGCYHVLPPERRQEYVRTVTQWLKPGGTLFLKCFSRLEPGDDGPYRFTPEDIRELFGRRLRVLSLDEVTDFGSNGPPRRALFGILRK